MKQYSVIVTLEVYVEAESENDAQEIAMETLSEMSIMDHDLDVTVDELE